MPLRCSKFRARAVWGRASSARPRVRLADRLEGVPEVVRRNLAAGDDAGDT
jgi:hypothetical protein